jgi:adenylylsulfate kinase
VRLVECGPDKGTSKMAQKSFTVWLTGLPAAGKSTLAGELVKKLTDLGNSVELLDGEQVRSRLGDKYGHSLVDRYHVLNHIIDFAKAANEHGKIAIVAAVSPKADMRMKARTSIDNFFEVHLDCSVQDCAARDYKGVYSRTLAQDEYFPGLTEPYEISKPELTLSTSRESVEVCAQKLVQEVQKYSNQL